MRTAVAALVLLLGATLAGCTGAAHVAAAPAQLKSGVHVISMPGDRTVTVHVPKHLDGPAPLVLVLHEFGGVAATAMGYGFDPLVDSAGFVAVYPDGIEGSWNAGGCCGTAAESGKDDVAFLTSVVHKVEARTPIDPKRVYVAGFSNGAMMSYRLACETKLFAAIAPISGDVETGCDHPTAASVMHIHGLADTEVTFDASSDEPWRTADACRPPTVTQAARVHRSTAECADDRSVEVVTVDGLAHAIPTAADGFDAAAQIWAFFAAHPRP
ncbi:PHB depolymerase family esterase [Gryllotalpicola daejeonensis]|uniref:PHB depolymerase family esterase n=1 Tax=Gryllotalpicola daejeonensis TaxID=993087 RepID=A0ABP7ZKJ5_9MICO